MVSMKITFKNGIEKIYYKVTNFKTKLGSDFGKDHCSFEYIDFDYKNKHFVEIAFSEILIVDKWEVDD